MISYNTDELSVQRVHQLLLGSVGPRPICFASTVDKNGKRNLAPFSFFNVVSANPPILVFAPNNSGRTGEPKHTYLNIKEVAEVVVNIVNFNMVQQMSLASSPYSKETDEFLKAGFTPVASDLIKPFRVKESPVQLECRVENVIEFGKEGGSGNLIICRVVKIHVDESILTENEQIDQTKIDLVARMGGNWYCRAHGDALFEIEKPLTTCGIGIDVLPIHIRNSEILSGNDLGILGNIETIPSEIEIETASKEMGKINWSTAKQLIQNGDGRKALAWLWSNNF